MKRSSSAFTRMVSDRIYFAWFPIGAQFVGDGGNKITTQSLHRASSHNNILPWPRKSNKTFDTCVHRDNQVQNSCHDCDRNERHPSELFFLTFNNAASPLAFCWTLWRKVFSAHIGIPLTFDLFVHDIGVDFQRNFMSFTLGLSVTMAKI